MDFTDFVDGSCWHLWLVGAVVFCSVSSLSCLRQVGWVVEQAAKFQAGFAEIDK